MAVEFAPVMLDGAVPDQHAMLVYRDGRLSAVLTCLSDIHGELAGQWFVEALFNTELDANQNLFEDLAHARAWAGRGACATV